MIIIKKATYGDQDCTKEVSKLAVGGNLAIRADNNIIGDPRHGERKILKVNYSVNGEDMYDEVLEGDFFVVKSTSNNKLGIFYSNNTNPKTYPAIYKSLDTIKRASEGVADIVTCVWNPIPNNPFVELISWMKNGGHLNQLLQILQCLYYAKKNGEYDWVSFLEHDVMYPEDYFMFDDFKQENATFTNMNYIGICKNGFQEKKQNDKPFHQMTMRFNEAISHCESMLENAIMNNSGLIEPQGSMDHITWNCKNPSVHINHGSHFTSHFSIYDSINTKDSNEYWGHYEKYSGLFF